MVAKHMIYFSGLPYSLSLKSYNMINCSAITEETFKQNTENDNGCQGD